MRPATLPACASAAVAFEQKHVHDVYDAVSSDFARTRGLMEDPHAAAFLRSLPTGSVVLDAGCGNGRNSIGYTHATLRERVCCIGIDRCASLCTTARSSGGGESQPTGLRYRQREVPLLLIPPHQSSSRLISCVRVRACVCVRVRVCVCVCV